MRDFQMINRFNTGSAKWDGMRKKHNKEEFLAFSVADSDYPTAQPIIEALQKRLNHGAFGYTMLDSEYFDIVKDWYNRQYNVTIKKNWIVPSSKVLSGLSFLIQALTNEDDSVMLQTPVYNMFDPVIKQNKRPVVENPLLFKDQTYSIDFKAMENAFQQGVKVLLFCNPHNPVGRVWRQDELKHLVELAKQYDVFILSDEIHGDLIMKGHSFTSLASFFKDYENIVVVSAPSKTFNVAGFQGSNMIIPKRSLRDAMKRILRKNFLSSPNMMAITAIKAAYTECDEWVEKQNNHIYQNYQHVKNFLSPYNLSIAPLEGTYLLWLDCRTLNMTSNQLFEHFLNHGVLLAKGPDYGKAYDGFLRMNVAVSKVQLEEGLNRLKKALDKL